MKVIPEIQLCTQASDQTSLALSLLCLYFPLPVSLPFSPLFCLVVLSYFPSLPTFPFFILPSQRRLHAPQGREPTLVTCPFLVACLLSSVQGQLEEGDQHLGLTNYDISTD